MAGADVAVACGRRRVARIRGSFSGVTFHGGYAVLAILGVPTTVLVLAAGGLFGAGAGFASAQTGAITAAAVSFLLARHVARDWVRRRLMCRRRSRALLEVMDEQGWRMVILTRLNPFIPVSIKNYGFGLTRISFAAYLLATLAVQAPVLLVYTYLGSAANLSQKGWHGPQGGAAYLFYGAGAVVAIVHVVLVTWCTRRKLRQAASGRTAADAGESGHCWRLNRTVLPSLYSASVASPAGPAPAVIRSLARPRSLLRRLHFATGCALGNWQRTRPS